MPDFAVDVSKWVDRAREKAREAFRATAMDAVARVKELTPVDTGYLRANWVDVLNEEAVDKPKDNVEPGRAIERAEIGDRIKILNPVQYARRIEYGFVGQDKLGRNYNQQGRGMVKQTVQELPDIAKRATQRVRQGG